MKIEIRNVHYSERFSEETSLFDAMVYVDGRRVGMVSNEGHGGPNNYDFDTTELERFAASLPPVKCEWAEGGKMAMDLELLIGDLLDEWLKAKEFKRLTKNKTVFKLRGDKDGEFRVVKVPFGPEIKGRMVAKYGAEIEFFLNERTSL